MIDSMSKVLSILMPTHNRADILPIALKSFESLSIPAGWHTEMVIVANACTDNTCDVLDEHIDKLPFPTRYVVEPVAGSSQARNRGVQEARGEIFIFVDDDVLVSPNWLIGLINVFETTPADFVGGPVKLWWHAIERPEWFTSDFDSLLAAKEHGTEVIELDNPTAVITINIAYRRKIFDQVGGFRRDLERRGKGTGSYEDVEFNTRALEAGMRLFYAPSAPVQHWVEPSRMSFSAMSKMIFYVGQARVFAKPSLNLKVIMRSVIGNASLVILHLPLEGYYRIRGVESKAFAHRRLWVVGTGGFVGIAKRLLGRESGY